jgi:hypothetical protein
MTRREAEGLKLGDRVRYVIPTSKS